MNKTRRSGVWEVECKPAVGPGIRKMRPAVVMNVAEVGRLPLCIVAPITEWKPECALFSWFVRLDRRSENGLSKESVVDAFQVKSVPENRLICKLAQITEEQADQVAAAIALCIGC